jgi:hypothetical protein
MVAFATRIAQNRAPAAIKSEPTGMMIIWLLKSSFRRSKSSTEYGGCVSTNGDSMKKGVITNKGADIKYM